MNLARSALVPLLGGADLEDKATGWAVGMDGSGTAGGCPGVPCSWVTTRGSSVFSLPVSASLLVVTERRFFLGEELLEPEAPKESDGGGIRVPLLFGVAVKIALLRPSISLPVCTLLPWMMVKSPSHRKDAKWNTFQTYTESVHRMFMSTWKWDTNERTE